ncbi:zinc ribbon domain-containing protein [Jiulongibacter sediminis]|uniref:Zinc ribbon domain protein n=1 Tax=Jiulongibacter sediminis TaxID=1605367 RepID=A0A0P7BJ50_9BACT|nr:C4-type zinc ribbon domain-containing protein [Jiulongibacter sediminis]KPM47200.1 zinc ribbon domain protein [Jiulongibacter sediminis]TBX22758.1 zinc ribbon domain protein [Jiulongibacter sediminis]
MELTIADKLESLVKLQEIDSRLDELRKLRGDLPEEVKDLEDEVTGIEKRISRFQSEVDSLNEEIEHQKQNKKDSDKLILKYKDQQMNVRNNREYDAISKELELQELEIQLADKRIRETEYKIKTKEQDIEETQSKLDARKEVLEQKRKELDKLIVESQEEEEKLLKSSARQAKKVEERLLKAYTKIRGGAKNGLAVVAIDRGACGGCFNVVPPQIQADVMEKLKIIVCEHCGRILADADSIKVHRKRK